MSLSPLRVLGLAWIAAVACVDDVDSRCLAHDNPTLEIGTGVEAFEALMDGQDLRMQAGLQGGCHVWVSLRTDGLAAPGLLVEYDVVRPATGESTGSAASAIVELEARDDAEGLCEFVGFTAFLESPWTFQDERVRLELTLTDANGRKATASREFVARWPESGPSGDPRQWCGFRE